MVEVLFIFFWDKMFEEFGIEVVKVLFVYLVFVIFIFVFVFCVIVMFDKICGEMIKLMFFDKIYV